MKRHPAQCGNLAVTAALGAVAFGALFAGAVAYVLHVTLRTPTASPGDPPPPSRCHRCGAELSDPEFFTSGGTECDRCYFERPSEDEDDEPPYRYDDDSDDYRGAPPVVGGAP